MRNELTLKEIIEQYELPLCVKKPSWWGDFYFKIIQPPVKGMAVGNRYSGNEYYDHQKYSLNDIFSLYGNENVKKITSTSSDIIYTESPSLRKNYNHLNLNEKNYRKGLTTLYVVEKNKEIKAGIFQKFDVKDNQRIIYLSIDGEPRFYYFPNSEYVFSSKDDAIKSLSEKQKSNAGATVREIIDAYSELPFSVESPEDYDDALEEEKEYHKAVDEKLEKDISSNTERKKNAEDKITDAKFQWIDEYKENKNAPFSKKASYTDDYLVISSGLTIEENRHIAEQANKKIVELNETRKKPYFGRIDCGNSLINLHTAYIGDEDIEGYVKDWRNPEIGNVYYNTSVFQSDSNLVIALKRIIDIESGIFESFEDEINQYGGETSGSVELRENSDEMLIKLLKESRKNKAVHDIIKSIQVEQYRIITSDFKSNIVVNGCAGSGKTMIMYHRLSYIAYNYEAQTQSEFQPESVYVITPSPFFDSLNIELLKKLKLDGINNAPLAERIHRFICEASLKEKLLPNLFTLLDSDKGKISHDGLEERFDSLNELHYELDQDILSSAKFYLWLFKKMNDVLEKYGFEKIDFSYCGDTSNWISDTLNTTGYYYNECFASIRDLYDKNLKEIFTRTSYDNILEAVNEMEDGAARKAERINKLRKYEKLLRECLGKTVERDIDNGGVSSNVHGFWSLFDSTRTLERALVLILVEKYLEKITENDTDCLDILKLEYLIEKHCNDVPRYERDLLLSRQLLEMYFDTSDLFKASFVFIDEFQNYSPFELKCVSEMFGSKHPAFNLYGDFDQRIAYNGISDLKEISDVLPEPEIYPLTVNYRNAKDITDYINKRTNKSMKSIGISGNVSETVASECDFNIIDRTAVITKDVKTASDILSLIVEKEKINDTSLNRIIKENSINIMSVEDCKGLEFDTVYVFTENMNNNELYVALTRALNTLVVVSDDLSNDNF